MTAGQAGADAEVLTSIASPDDELWRDLFSMKLWTQGSGSSGVDVDELGDLLYRLGLVTVFDWPSWYSPEQYAGGRGLETASTADAVRLITSYIRGDRFSDGALASGLHDGAIGAAVRRLWEWYREAVGRDDEFVDWADYSADGTYRWSYERRWGPGGALCWVGLNPGTGDRDAGPRPTLRRVVGWARREGCAAVNVVNLFSYRTTDPEALRTASVDIVGDRTDATLRTVSSEAQLTLAAWGGNTLARQRSAKAVGMLTDPMCVGLTKSGQPRHPLYVAAATPFMPYQKL